MFNYLYVSNIEGIDKHAMLDFRSTSRKKENKNTIFHVNNTRYISKIAGIIGGNASGKSSVIDSIIAIAKLLRYSENEYKSFVIATRKDFDLINNKTGIEDVLPKQNAKRRLEMSVIRADVYIPKGERPGYYNYVLKYNSNLEIKMKEKLTYRESYKSKSIEILKIEKANLESDIGYKYNHRESIANDYLNVDKKLYEKFIENMKYYDTFYNHFVKQSSIYYENIFRSTIQYIAIEQWLKRNENLVNMVANLVDKKIDRITVEKNKVDGTDEIVIYNKNKDKLSYGDLSEGTKKLLYLINNAIKVIDNEGILIVDEIENSLHMDLIKLIIKLFGIEKNGAQIIFTTNNENVLDEEYIRNDQIYCISRENDEKMKIKKYSDMDGVRYDTVFKKNYRNKANALHVAQPNESEILKFVNYIETKYKQ